MICVGSNNVVVYGSRFSNSLMMFTHTTVFVTLDYFTGKNASISYLIHVLKDNRKVNMDT